MNIPTFYIDDLYDAYKQTYAISDGEENGRYHPPSMIVWFPSVISPFIPASLKGTEEALKATITSV